MTAPSQDDWLIDGPPDAERTLVLAHGAGAPMDSPFLTSVAEGLAAAGIRVVRFEFPYMRARRLEGRRPPPDGPAALHDAWYQVIEALGGGAGLAIGGKSLGGRVAADVADAAGVSALVCLGYPFHPPGRPERARTRPLEKIRTPTLIVQGSRDPFGRPDEVARYSLSPRVHVVWIEDGDHSLKPRKSSGRTERENLAEAVEHVTDFVAQH